MAVKWILMGFCSLYALARLIATAVYYTTARGELLLAVMIIAAFVSIAGLTVTVHTVIRRNVKGRTVRTLLALYGLAAVANILITRMSPPTAGVGPLDVLIMGSLFEVLLFAVSLLIPLPDSAAKK